MNKLYKTTQSILPPIIFKMIIGSNIYKKIKPNIKKYFGEKLPAQWNQIKVGLLKGTWFYFYPNGEWQNKMLNEDYDKELFDSIRKLNLKGKTIFDIGSHIGYHSIFFSKLVGPSGKIFSFEPNPFNAKRIQENVDKNLIKNIKVNNIALSSENTETDFLFSENIENGTSSGGFINESDTFYSKDTYENGIGFKRMKVLTQKIDNLEDIKNNVLKIDILKIDVEGAESLVLEGGINTILRDKPIILIEIHTISNMFYFMDFINRIDYTYNLLKREPDGRHLIFANKR